MGVLHLEHALSTSLWTHLGGNHISDCNINGTCGGYVMDDGRPLKSKGTSHPQFYPAATAAPELKKRKRNAEKSGQRICQRNSQIPNSQLSFKSQGM